jgi:DUF917 family protein
MAVASFACVEAPRGTDAPDGPDAQVDPPIRTLTEQELVDMMVGAGIFCSRGIDTRRNIDRITDAVRQGQTFRMIALEDVPDDWFGFTSFGIGGGGAWQDVIDRYEAQGFEPDPARPTPEQILGEYIGRQFTVTFQAEAGGATVGALLTAARLGIPIIDGGPSGRCLPEVQMSPFNLNSGITRAPFAGVTRYGDVFIFPTVYDDSRTEDLTRSLAVASGGGVRVAANALSGAELKENLIPAFLSQCIRLGRAAREAVEAGSDPVQAVVEAGGGFVLFKGTVTRSESRGERGFGWTDAYLAGIGEYEGSEYHIYNKNENMVAWRDGELNAAAPDIIAAVDPATGWAMRGGEAVIGSFRVGEELTVIGFPAAALWRTPQAIEALGPRHFGFDIDFVPIEELHGQSP